MNNLKLEQLLNTFLNSPQIKDYTINGMQIEGRTEVKKIVTGVTASQALIDYAVHVSADAILVHHGYFWKSESPAIRGMKHKRIKALIQNDINLYAYHLPLDMHPTLGNNVLLAKLLTLDIKTNIDDLVIYGELSSPMQAEDFAKLIANKLNRQPLHIATTSTKMIQKIALCSGGGQDYIDLAATHGMDAFISGEISERTVHSAREQNIHYYAAGHHATERYGIKALGEWLAQQHHLEVEFVDIDNPV